MVKWLVLSACFAALVGCSKFENYKVSVDDPSRKSRAFDAPFDGFSGIRDIYPH